MYLALFPTRNRESQLLLETKFEGFLRWCTIKCERVFLPFARRLNYNIIKLQTFRKLDSAPVFRKEKDKGTE